MVGVFEPGSVCLVHRARLQFLKEAPGERTLCMGRGRKVPVLSTKYAEFVCLLSSRLGTNFSGVGSWLILIFITFVWDQGFIRIKPSFTDGKTEDQRKER